jgi:large subunit ribosomal protein L17
MRHRLAGRSFGRRSGPRNALIRGLVTNLIRFERITTTVAKAKELRRFIEPLITLAKRGDLHARRLASGKVYTADALQKLFDDLGPRFKTRPGGYTRILRSVTRQGDGAPLAIIELLDRPVVKTDNAKKTNTKKDAEAKAPKKTAEKKEAAKKTSAKKEEKKPAAKKDTKKTKASK